MSGMKNTAQKVTSGTAKILYGPLAKYAPEVKMHKKVSDKVAKNLSAPREAPPPPAPTYGGIYQTGMPDSWNMGALGQPSAAAPAATVPTTGKPGRLTPEQIDAALSARNANAPAYSGSVPAIQQGGAMPGSFMARLASLQGNRGR